MTCDKCPWWEGADLGLHIIFHHWRDEPPKDQEPK